MPTIDGPEWTLSHWKYFKVTRYLFSASKFNFEAAQWKVRVLWLQWRMVMNYWLIFMKGSFIFYYPPWSDLTRPFHQLVSKGQADNSSLSVTLRQFFISLSFSSGYLTHHVHKTTSRYCDRATDHCVFEPLVQKVSIITRTASAQIAVAKHLQMGSFILFTCLQRWLVQFSVNIEIPLDNDSRWTLVCSSTECHF